WRRAFDASKAGDAAGELSALAEVTQTLAQSAHLGSATVNHELGRIHHRLALYPDVTNDDRQGHLSAAADFLERAISLDLPGGIETPAVWYVHLADALGEVGVHEGYQRAIEMYSVALDSRPPSISITAAGDVVELTGEDPDLPASALALAGRAAARAALEQDAGAIEDSYAALRLAPRYAFPLHTLAEVFGKRREYERALDARQRAKGLIVSVVGAVPYHQWTADIYRKQAAEIPDPAERERLLRSAIAELREALARTPKPDVDVQIRTDLVACL